MELSINSIKGTHIGTNLLSHIRFFLYRTLGNMTSTLMSTWPMQRVESVFLIQHPTDERPHWVVRKFFICQLDERLSIFGRAIGIEIFHEIEGRTSWTEKAVSAGHRKESSCRNCRVEMGENRSIYFFAYIWSGVCRPIIIRMNFIRLYRCYKYAKCFEILSHTIVLKYFFSLIISWSCNICLVFELYWKVLMLTL